MGELRLVAVLPRAGSDYLGRCLLLTRRALFPHHVIRNDRLGLGVRKGVRPPPALGEPHLDQPQNRVTLASGQDREQRSVSSVYALYWTAMNDLGRLALTTAHAGCAAAKRC